MYIILPDTKKEYTLEEITLISNILNSKHFGSNILKSNSKSPSNFMALTGTKVAHIGTVSIQAARMALEGHETLIDLIDPVNRIARIVERPRDRVGVNRFGVIQKSNNPYDVDYFKKLVNKTGARLSNWELEQVVPRIREITERFRNLKSFDQLKGEMSRLTENLFVASSVSFVDWEQILANSLKQIGKLTRTDLARKYLPRLTTTDDDIEAVAGLAKDQAVFLRNQYGIRSAQLTEKARKIIGDGLKNGFSPIDVGAQLAETLPGTWNRKNYHRTVAANAMSRARSFTEYTAYIESGIQWIEVRAVLDERTTDICRYLDGQIISMDQIRPIMTGIAAADTPEEAIEVSPFLRTRVIDGKTHVISGRGNTVGIANRSGFGAVDDRGDWQRLRNGKQLSADGIGMPPYHHNCRSYTVPRFEMTTVPRNYTVMAQDVPIAGEGYQLLDRPLEFFEPGQFETKARIEKSDIDIEQTIQGVMNTIVSLISNKQADVNRRLTTREIANIIKSLVKPRSSFDFTYAEPYLDGITHTRVNSDKYYKQALRYAPDWIVDALGEYPPIIKSEQFPHYNPRRKAIFIKNNNDYNAVRLIWHWIGEHLGIGELGVMERNKVAFPGQLMELETGVYYFQGPWFDPFDGALPKVQSKELKFYNKSEIMRFSGKYSNYIGAVACRFLIDNDAELVLNYQLNPRQVALFVALMQRR